MITAIFLSLPAIAIAILYVRDRYEKCRRCGKGVWVGVTSISPTGPNPLKIAMYCRRYRCEACKNHNCEQA